MERTISPGRGVDRLSRATLRAWLTEERIAWIALGLAVAVAALLMMWVTRDTTFYNLDELTMYSTTGWDVDVLLTPFLGQIILVTRVAFLIVLGAAGADYTVVRLVGVVAAIAPAVLLFVFARPRIGPAAALAPALLLLFFGSAWEHILWPFTAISAGSSLATGLGALIALDRNSQWGDITACVLLCLSVAAFAIGIAFTVGVAVSVLLSRRWNQAWVFLVPLALYGIWWLWALKFGDSQLAASNVLVVPAYIAASLSAVGAALAGLNYDFGAGVGFNHPPTLDTSWGPAIAILALLGLAMRFRMGSIPPLLWGSLAILAAYWISGAMVLDPPPGFRWPGVSRYLYPSAVLVLLVAVVAAAGWRPSRGALIALFAVVAFAISANVANLRGAGNYLRAYSDAARAQFAALELARPHGVDTFNPGADTPEVSPVQLLFNAGPYFQGADRYGSIAFSIPELMAQDESVRHGADVVLAEALDVALTPGESAAGSDCRTVGGSQLDAGPVVDLPSGGALLTAQADTTVAVRRFADFTTIELGELYPERPMELQIPTDTEPRPWVASLEASGPVRVCRLASP
jgi:hypothetical protein